MRENTKLLFVKKKNVYFHENKKQFLNDLILRSIFFYFLALVMRIQ